MPDPEADDFPEVMVLVNWESSCVGNQNFGETRTALRSPCTPGPGTAPDRGYINVCAGVRKHIR